MAKSNFSLLGKEINERLKRRARFIKALDKRWKWIGYGAICFALFGLLSFFPAFTERFYSRGIFVAVRYFYDYTLGLLPFSVTLWLNLTVLIYIIIKVLRYIKRIFRKEELSFKDKAKYGLLSIGGFAGKVSVIFFIGWGFNFHRTPIEQQLNFEMAPLNQKEILIEANFARKQAVKAREKLNLGDKAFMDPELPGDLENLMRTNLEEVLVALDYPTPGKPRCRFIDNNKWLRMFGYTGVYVSFYGEALVSSSDIRAVYRPFFIAHELVHAYGFHDEATANFLAFLACEHSTNYAIKYSGRLVHLMYLRHEIKAIKDKGGLGYFKSYYPKQIQTDFEANGIFGSNKNYNRMILLVKGFRLKYGLNSKNF